jgi:uncharacterized iron-regulated protein
MKKYLIFSVVFLMWINNSYSNDPRAYKIFESDGGKADLGDIIDEALDNEIVLFGELHNSAISHWLQLRLAKELNEETEGKLAIGMEMFEADNQLLINEYMAGLIREKNFEQEARLWKNYKTDYKPVLEFAREKNLPFIATNIPRRYAAVVARESLDSLMKYDDHTKMLFPPLPVPFDSELPGYKKMMEMGMAGHGMDYIAQSQALKDATMAHFINKNLVVDGIFLHLNGTFHSDNYEGINWYLKNYNPDVKILTIATVEQDDIDDLEEENEGKADFIIVVPSDLTKTH